MRHALVFLLVLLASSAQADVVPDGKRYIPVEHTLSGTAQIGDYTLFLVTLNDRMRNHVRVDANIGDGPLSLPSSYRSSSFLVALTPQQVAELERAREGRWSDEPADESAAPSKLRTFFDRDDLAISGNFSDRSQVDESSTKQSLQLTWTVVKVDGNKIVLKLPDAAQEDSLLVPIVAAGAAAALVVLAVLLLRRRRVVGPA